MKILKDNYSDESYLVKREVKKYKSYPRKLECEECGSELEYEESDIHMGALGCMHLKCPLCGNENMLEDNEHNIELTYKNIEFPTHFFHHSKETGAVDICNNEEVKKYISNAIKYFRENKDDYHCESGSGNLYVSVHRYSGDEDYYVVVSNNYYDTYIPFKKEDY